MSASHTQTYPGNAATRAQQCHCQMCCNKFALPALSAFVSAELGEKHAARRAFGLLNKLGVRVTHDWTRTDDLIDKWADPVEAGRRAAADISGVVESDIYVLLSDNVNPGRGMYVELGAALALKEMHGSPEVFIVGAMNHLSIFYLHPEIVHCHDMEELEQMLRTRLSVSDCA